MREFIDFGRKNKKEDAQKLGLPDNATWEEVDKAKVLNNEVHEREVFIWQLEEPAESLLSSLRKKIDNVEYDSILGDDTKARIHSLFLGNAIKEIYGQRKDLKMVFVQGGYLLKEDEQHRQQVKEYLKRMKPMLGRKTLIITEEIASAKSAEQLAELLESIGIQVDVASFGIFSESEYGDQFPSKEIHTDRGRLIYIGDWRSPGYMVPHSYAGLEPRAGRGVETAPRSGGGHAVKAELEEDEDRREVVESREILKEVAHKLAQGYLTKAL